MWRITWSKLVSNFNSLLESTKTTGLSVASLRLFPNHRWFIIICKSSTEPNQDRLHLKESSRVLYKLSSIIPCNCVRCDCQTDRSRSTKAVAEVIMLPPDAPVTSVLVLDCSIVGDMDEGGCSPVHQPEKTQY